MQVKLNTRQLQINSCGDLYTIITGLGETYLVNNVGLDIIKYIISEFRRLEDIVEYISSKYYVSKEEILNDILEFINTLDLLGLIECQE